ncbi:unnamed protein product [Amoebophrya sp. A25]|nr:unnamed protein product [Amoebophrya sp. A25]|eukprot:GSA25T00016134001.1
MRVLAQWGIVVSSSFAAAARSSGSSSFGAFQNAGSEAPLPRTREDRAGSTASIPALIPPPRPRESEPTSSTAFSRSKGVSPATAYDSRLPRSYSFRRPSEGNHDERPNVEDDGDQEHRLRSFLGDDDASACGPLASSSLALLQRDCVSRSSPASSSPRSAKSWVRLERHSDSERHSGSHVDLEYYQEDLRNGSSDAGGSWAHAESKNYGDVEDEDGEYNLLDNFLLHRRDKDLPMEELPIDATPAWSESSEESIPVVEKSGLVKNDTSAASRPLLVRPTSRNDRDDTTNEAEAPHKQGSWERGDKQTQQNIHSTSRSNRDGVPEREKGTPSTSLPHSSAGSCTLFDKPLSEIKRLHIDRIASTSSPVVSKDADAGTHRSSSTAAPSAPVMVPVRFGEGPLSISMHKAGCSATPTTGRLMQAVGQVDSTDDAAICPRSKLVSSLVASERIGRGSADIERDTDIAALLPKLLTKHGIPLSATPALEANAPLSFPHWQATFDSNSTVTTGVNICYTPKAKRKTPRSSASVASCDRNCRNEPQTATTFPPVAAGEVDLLTPPSPPPSEKRSPLQLDLDDDCADMRCCRAKSSKTPPLSPPATSLCRSSSNASTCSPRGMSPIAQSPGANRPSLLQVGGATVLPPPCFGKKLSGSDSVDFGVEHGTPASISRSQISSLSCYSVCPCSSSSGSTYLGEDTRFAGSCSAAVASMLDGPARKIAEIKALVSTKVRETLLDETSSLEDVDEDEQVLALACTTNEETGDITSTQMTGGLSRTSSDSSDSGTATLMNPPPQARSGSSNAMITKLGGATAQDLKPAPTSFGLPSSTSGNRGPPHIEGLPHPLRVIASASSRNGNSVDAVLKPRRRLDLLGSLRNLRFRGYRQLTLSRNIAGAANTSAWELPDQSGIGRADTDGAPTAESVCHLCRRLYESLTLAKTTQDGADVADGDERV